MIDSNVEEVTFHCDGELADEKDQLHVFAMSPVMTSLLLFVTEAPSGQSSAW